MKKRISIGMIFVLCISALLTGCGKETSETTEFASKGDYGGGYVLAPDEDYSQYGEDLGEVPEKKNDFAGPWITYVNPEVGVDEGESGEGSHEDNTTVKGKVYSKIVVTGIEDWQIVGDSVYGLMGAFHLDYIDANGEMTYGYYAPGTPDRLEFSFDTETGEALSAIYYGSYNTPEDAEMGKEALEANIDSFDGDIRSCSVSGTNMEISFDPSSARFDSHVRTWFLEGRHDPERFTEDCERTFNNANSIYTEFKGDNWACDVINGIKVTWYE